MKEARAWISPWKLAFPGPRWNHWVSWYHEAREFTISLTTRHIGLSGWNWCADVPGLCWELVWMTFKPSLSEPTAAILGRSANDHFDPQPSFMHTPPVLFNLVIYRQLFSLKLQERFLTAK